MKSQLGEFVLSYMDSEISVQQYILCYEQKKIKYIWLGFIVSEHAQSLATEWMWVYNNERPHSSIG